MSYVLDDHGNGQLMILDDNDDDGGDNYSESYSDYEHQTYVHLKSQNQIE